MNDTTTYAPIPSAARAPAASADLFDFLQDPHPAPVEEEVKVFETASEGMVVVTVQKADGRSLTREIAVDSWTQDGYRESLIEVMLSVLG